MSSLIPNRKFLFGLVLLLCTQTTGMYAEQTAASQSSDKEKTFVPDPANTGDSQKTANDKKPESGYTARDSMTPAVASRPLEDWDTLTVPAGLKFNVEEVDKTEFPEFSKQLLRATWRGWDPIDLWVIKPAGVKNPPVILYLQSFPTNSDRYYNNDYCKFLTKNGFAAVGFVSALTGHRFHDRPTKTWFVSELKESMATSVHDVQFILNYLGQRGDFDMSRVGMVGDGSGGSIAIMAAAVDPRIKVLDLVEPWGDWPDWLAKSPVVPANERPDYLKPEFLKNVENVDPLKWLPELKTQRVRLTYVLDTTSTPQDVRNRLAAAAPENVKIARYADAEDFVSEVTSSQRAFDWIKEQLMPGTTIQMAGPSAKPEPNSN